MSGFNNSTRNKEDVSLKLKSQNIRNAKDTTRRLEEESRKMELRLHELKLAMSKEKEEREKQGGQFWKSGNREGTLTTHAQDVLKKNIRQIEKSKAKGSKVRKVTVLKDEPIVTKPRKVSPEHSAQPGTMAYLAKSNPDAPIPKESSRMKGPKCGQCERKVAAVICHECGEDYCPGCFASFHLKGALRKHRSIPLQANGPRPSPRVSYSPRPPRQQMMTPQKKAMLEFERRQTTPRQNKQSVAKKTVIQENGSSASSGEPFTGPSLLEGQYNEDESAAAFQAALEEWRNDKGAARPCSPVKSPIVSIESSTSTMPQKEHQPEIVYHSSMTYAEKLLLKKHRRTELEALSTTPSTDPMTRPISAGIDRGLSTMCEEHVDFQALFEAAVTPRVEGEYRGPTSIIQVTEVEPNANTRGIEQVTSYEVMEESDPEVDALLQKNKKNQKNSKTSSTKSGRRSADRSKLPPSGKGRTSLERESTGNKSATKLENTENRKMDRPNSRVKREKSDTGKKSTTLERRNSVEKIDKEKTDVSVKENHRASSAAKNKSKPSENNKDVADRPPSRNKSRLGHTGQSRPQSRAKSRGGTRPWSRADIIDGNLTKRPSDDLKAIASRSVERVTPVPYLGLEDILTIGVSQEAAPTVDRVMTPSYDRPQSRAKTPAAKKQTVSYKLYQMAPRSWKPAVSLGDQVEIKPEDLVDYTHAFDMAVVPSTGEDMELEQEIKALAGITQPSVEVIRERSEVRLSQTEDIPPVPVSPDLPLPSPLTTPRQQTPSLTPHPPETNTPRRRSGKRSPRKQERNETPRSATAASGRESRMIVVDGNDMTEFDNVYEYDHQEQGDRDEETLDQLEWELASEAGRITADGKISRMTTLMTDDLACSASFSSGDEDRVRTPVTGFEMDPRVRWVTKIDLARSASFSSGDEDRVRTPVTGFEMDPRVSEEDLMYDYEDIERQVADEDEVRALR